MSKAILSASPGAVRSRMGTTSDSHFTTLQEKPLASASIGQAHRGTLKDGKEVVVKVQHPGIISAIQVDLDLFEKRFL